MSRLRLPNTDESAHRLQRPRYVWRKAADLAGSDLLFVCTIPVEPGAYSSCRDAAGIRRTAFVPKDSVIMGGRNSVIVSKTGGDYTDPVTAAENAFAGDTWCVAPQWPDTTLRHGDRRRNLHPGQDAQYCRRARRVRKRQGRHDARRRQRRRDGGLLARQRSVQRLDDREQPSRWRSNHRPQDRTVPYGGNS